MEEVGHLSLPVPTVMRGQQFNPAAPYGRMGHEYDKPGSSAFGTEHPLDKALGRVRRISNLSAMAKGSGSSGSSALHEASAVMNVQQPQVREGL